MAIDDPKDLERVDRDIQRNELREELGMDLHISDDCPPEVEAEFLERVRAYEQGPLLSSLDRLAARGYTPPPAEGLADEELSRELARLITELAAISIFIGNTDHLSDRELYTHLVEESLHEAYGVVATSEGSYCHLDLIGSGSDGDIQLWLRHYANGEDRSHWARDFPNDQMPAHEPPQFDRDRHLPKPPC